jgi:excisionase family DNA binding protein
MESVTITEAARRLSVSVVKIRNLVREGVLPATSNPLDKREKLIPLEAVQELAKQRNAVTRPWPRSVGMIADATFQSEDAEAYMEAHRSR